MSGGPLDVMLCPACVAEVAWVRHEDEDGTCWSCWCEACDYTIGVSLDQPYTLRDMIEDDAPWCGPTWGDVDLQAWTREVALRALRDAASR